MITWLKDWVEGHWSLVNSGRIVTETFLLTNAWCHPNTSNLVRNVFSRVRIRALCRILRFFHCSLHKSSWSCSWRTSSQGLAWLASNRRLWSVVFVYETLAWEREAHLGFHLVIDIFCTGFQTIHILQIFSDAKWWLSCFNSPREVYFTTWALDREKTWFMPFSALSWWLVGWNRAWPPRGVRCRAEFAE